MKLLLSIFLVISGLSIFAQTPNIRLDKGEKIKYEGELMGVYKDKTWLIPAKYNSLEEFYWNYIIAQRGNIFDIYTLGAKSIIVSNLTITQVETYKAFLATENDPVFNGKWGFTNEYFTQPAIYDSIFVICTTNGASCNVMIGLVNGNKMGAIDNLGNLIVPFGDYTKITYEFFKIPIQEHSFLAIATKQNGQRDFFTPYFNFARPSQQLVDFEAQFDMALGVVNEVNSFWNNLQVFRNAAGNLGLITGSGELFLPAAAKEIRFQSLVLTAYQGGGIYSVNEGVFKDVSTRDTINIASLLRTKYFTGNTSIMFIPAGLEEDFIQNNIKPDYKYQTARFQQIHCGICVDGVRYTTNVEVDSRVIKEAQQVTEIKQMGWTDVNEYGRFQSVSTTYTIPAEIEQIVKTTPMSAVCYMCKGHVDYYKIFQWNQTTGLFEGFYKYGL